MQRIATSTSRRMTARLTSSLFLLVLGVASFAANQCFAEISVGTLTKESAKERYGITMHATQNGDAGIKVWLEFKKEGWLEKFTYAELRITDAAGKHMISAMLQPNPVHHRQSKDTTTVSFSADPNQLAQCSFLVVCYNSSEGDVGYFLNVMDGDFLESERLAAQPAESGDLQLILDPAFL